MHEKLAAIGTYLLGIVGVIISALPAINNALQFILFVVSIAVMVQKFLHDRKKNKRPMNDNKGKEL